MSNGPQYNLEGFLNTSAYQEELAAQRSFMVRVYGWMTAGLMITAVTAFITATSQTLINLFVANNGMRIVLIIGTLALGFVLSLALGRLSAMAAAVLFVLYSIGNGVLMSILLLVYTSESIGVTFLITAGMFGGMSVFGYVTKKNLDGLGYFCTMGLWGLILASIVHLVLMIFTGGVFPMFSFLISVVGVIVFTGLTAYDTQKIKQMYAEGGTGSDENKKLAIFGAFMLYLDFINLFIYLLRLIGSRRN